MSSLRLRSILAAGFVSGLACLSPVASAQTPQPAPHYVKADAANVRGGPGKGNAVIAVLNLGAEVTIYVTSGEWARISGPGEPERWIYSPLLQDTKPPAPAPAHHENDKAPAPAPKAEAPPKSQPAKAEPGKPPADDPKQAAPSGKNNPDPHKQDDKKDPAPKH